MPRNYIIASIIVLTIILAGFFFFRGGETFSNLPGLNLANLFGGSEGVPAENIPDAEPVQELEPGYNLSPADFKINTTSGDGYYMATYEKGPKEGFQVFVTAFDEPGPITPERIWLDVDAEINNPKYIDVAGIQALAFDSEAEDFGKTFEVWFVQNGKLYQITTYAVYEKQLLKILETWKFQ